MLTQLIVENIALVDRLELEFEAGMSVITGETGAGKSIMLDALGLALGDRAESGLIAGAADKAEIHATFDIAGNTPVLAWLTERDLEAGTDECILRRLVSRDGRSRAYINGAPVTVTDLKTLGEMLIDIHSQHEHQSLLARETHRRLLDEFGGLSDIAGKVREGYEGWQETRRTLDAHLATREEQAARLALLNYQAQELETLGASKGEASALEAEQKLLANAESLLQSCNQALALCSENDDANALDQIARAINLLEELDVEPLRPIVEMLESSRIQLQEATHDISRFADGVEMDPARLSEVETRLSDLYEVARKHRIEPDEIPAFAAQIDAELASLENVSGEIEALDQALTRLRADYQSAARELSGKRSKAAKALESRVTSQLARLGMKGAEFSIALTQGERSEPAPGGLEDIEFLITTNPGQPPRPLGRIASGGELSRISLAIQVVVADTSRVPTLVFDEVDVGIGGAVAEVVGSMLRTLAKNAQIICVTHLPQVAAQGNHHFLVTKASSRSKASTSISVLEESDKVMEIARMLGGIELTEQSLAHAREMFAAAQAS